MRTHAHARPTTPPQNSGVVTRRPFLNPPHSLPALARRGRGGVAPPQFNCGGRTSLRRGTHALPPPRPFLSCLQRALRLYVARRRRPCGRVRRAHATAGGDTAGHGLVACKRLPHVCGLSSSAASSSSTGASIVIAVSDRESGGAGIPFIGAIPSRSTVRGASKGLSIVGDGP